MDFNTFMKTLFGKEGAKVEEELLTTMLYSLLTSFILLGVLYFFSLRRVPEFIATYSYPLFFSALSIALVMPAVRQVRAYKEMTCMSGMMIGMTLGMMIGMLLGFYVGMMNGMFYGGFFGTFVGIALGGWMGRCCGVMGVMEGTMAGFMGGLMGAMTAVMMYNDHLRLAGVFIFFISASIIFGLNYMIYKEGYAMERQHTEDQFLTILITTVLMAATTWLVVFGPRSAFLGG